MPLPLEDARWNKLESSYGSADDVVAMLEAAYAFGITEEQTGDLINEVQHQGGTSSAMYAVALHLIALAQSSQRDVALYLLTHAGIIYADACHPDAVSCPEFLQAEFEATARSARNCWPLFSPTSKTTTASSME